MVSARRSQSWREREGPQRLPPRTPKPPIGGAWGEPGGPARYGTRESTPAEQRLRQELAGDPFGVSNQLRPYIRPRDAAVKCRSAKGGREDYLLPHRELGTRLETASRRLQGRFAQR